MSPGSSFALCHSGSPASTPSRLDYYGAAKGECSMSVPSVPSAPTEAEIRATIETYLAEWPRPSDDLREVIVSFGDPVEYQVRPDEVTGRLIEYGNDVWTDLVPSQARRISQLMATAQERAFQRARAAIIEEYVSAALAFAAEFPDAPRAKAGRS
jgi:hypothetical protein